jgi:death on curing protein
MSWRRSVTYYLTTDDALEVASLVTGAPARVRDFTELTTALARPQQVSDGQDLYPGIWDKAAALMEALGRCYALVDGNKRLTWNATWFFLGVNGVPLADPLDEDAAQHFMFDLGRGRLTLPDIASGLQKFAGLPGSPPG